MLGSPDPTLAERRVRSPRGRLPRLALALGAAVLLALGAAACGSDDDAAGGSGNAPTTEQKPLGEDAYLRQVNAAQTDFASDAAKLNLADPPSPKAFAESLDRLGGLVDALRRRLDDIAAPAAVVAEHDELVEQLRDYGTIVAREQGDLSSGDPDRVKAAARAIAKASTGFSEEFEATIRQINDNLGLETGTAPG